MLRPLLVIAATAAMPALAQDAPFGSQEDQDYAGQLWQAMAEMHLAGEGAINTLPYEGVEPHGFVLETLYGQATVDGHTGDLVVKRNYGPEGVAVPEVQANRGEHLAAVTVMFRRAEGYDRETNDWFWVKYLPDGSLDQNPDGVPLAGMIGKGADAGCIACHSGAGEDFLFTAATLD
jgi:hypothetical protein